MDKMQLQNWEKRARRRLSFREDPARMTRIDWLVMLAITLIYAAVAFFNLGSTDVPQTFYTAQTQGEQIVITFDQIRRAAGQRHVFRLLFNGRRRLYAADA
jgi:hypothetical protein